MRIGNNVCEVTQMVPGLNWSLDKCNHEKLLYEFQVPRQMAGTLHSQVSKSKVDGEEGRQSLPSHKLQ